MKIDNPGNITMFVLGRLPFTYLHIYMYIKHIHIYNIYVKSLLQNSMVYKN